MHWINWIRHTFGQRDSSESLDVESVLSDGLRDPVSAHRAIDRIKDERKRQIRQAKVVENQYRRPTTRSVRQSGRLGPQLGTYQMTQDSRNADLASRDSSRAEQVVAIERQLAEIDAAISQLRDRIGQS